MIYISVVRGRKDQNDFLQRREVQWQRSFRVFEGEFSSIYNGLRMQMQHVCRLKRRLPALSLDPNPSNHFSHILKNITMAPEIRALDGPKFKFQHGVANLALDGMTVRQ